ncbi:selenoprotein S [Rhinophrynus dorsalis]
METVDGEVLKNRPDVEMELSQYLHETVGMIFSNYGWYILLGCIILYLLIQKVSGTFSQVGTSTSRTVADPDDVARRQEAMAAARMRMQEELNAQAEKYRQKQIQLEEEKRRQNIEKWERMKEGKGYKLASRLGQDASPSTSTSSPASSAQKPKTGQKPLRGGGFNPLTGGGAGTCSWRPGRRGPSSGG